MTLGRPLLARPAAQPPHRAGRWDGRGSRRQGGWCRWLALLVGGALLPGCASGAFRPAGEEAASLAGLWWFMLAASALVYVLVVGLLVVGLVRRRGEEGRGAVTDRRFILWGGLVLPAGVLSALVGVTIATLVDLPTADEARDVHVIGHQFWWEVRYGDEIVSANELHIPVGEKVRVRLSSDDVIHSFWVPELAGKRDMIPGQENTLVLEANEAGVYRGQCAEFCGVQHANMALRVVAHEPGEFETWAENAAEPAQEPTTTATRRGRDVFMQNCASCHAVRGTEAGGDVGPDLTHFASRRKLGAGVVANNRGNLGGWIVDSQAIKPGNPMPPQDVDPQRLDDLLDYLETLE